MSRTRVTSERKWALIVEAMRRALRDGAVTLRDGRKFVVVSTLELAGSIRRSGGPVLTSDALNSFARDQQVDGDPTKHEHWSVARLITIDGIRYSVHYARSKWRLEQESGSDPRVTR